MSQNYSRKIYPDNKTKRISKKNTKFHLDSLSYLLNFNNRERRIRKFELEFCERKSIDNEGLTWTPAGLFPSISGCPGIYTFTHSNKKSGSRYEITFFYNEFGEIVEEEVSYLVVHY